MAREDRKREREREREKGGGERGWGKEEDRKGERGKRY